MQYSDVPKLNIRISGDRVGQGRGRYAPVTSGSVSVSGNIGDADLPPKVRLLEPMENMSVNLPFQFLPTVQFM